MCTKKKNKTNAAAHFLCLAGLIYHYGGNIGVTKREPSWDINLTCEKERKCQRTRTFF